MADDATASALAAACSRSGVAAEAFPALLQALPNCRLLRLSFGLQNKVMISITVDLTTDGRTHASYVPIHPTAAAAAVLQNNPVVVVRQPDRRSPLWDQEDLYQREGCAALSVVSMPFYWPPRMGALWEGQPLPVPQNAGFTPTFGALTAAGDQPVSQETMNFLLDLAARTGRHVGPHVSMLIASLEGAGLLPSEAEAQAELQMENKDEEWTEDPDEMADLFGGEEAQSRAAASAAELLPALGPVPEAAPGGGVSASAAGRREGGAEPGEEPGERGEAEAAGSSRQQGAAAALEAAASAAAAASQGPCSSTGARTPVVPPALRQQQEHAAAAAGDAAGASSQAQGPSSASGSTPVVGFSSGCSSAPSMPSIDGARVVSALSLGVAPMPSPFSFGSLAFQAPSMEHAFAQHYARRNEKVDLAVLLLLLVGLGATATASVQAQAAWPAGMAALLLFTPYFYDARLYRNLRELLLAAVLVLLAFFLSSLAPAHSLEQGVEAGAGACTAPPGPGTAAAVCCAAGDHLLAGFGIAKFIVHTCGLHYLATAPLLLRIRISRAVPVQGASLAIALYRLPAAYTATLGRTDSVHVLLLGLLLTIGACAGLCVARELERQARGAWLERQQRRGTIVVPGPPSAWWSPASS